MPLNVRKDLRLMVMTRAAVKSDAAAAKAMLRDMVRIRRFEEEIYRQIDKGRILGTTHVSVGQEAVAVGGCSILRQGDRVTSTHRGHGHFLAAGGEMKRIMAELFGRSGGYCRGKGGTQHMACVELGFVGSNGITGGGLPFATGMALAMKMCGTQNLVVCFFGDGAVNQGTFHESLNMAAIWKLPIIYLLENNQYAMSSRITDMAGIERLADRAKAYGMLSRRIDGNDCLALAAAMAEVAVDVCAGKGPVLIEAVTYRLRGHSRNDRCHYRSRDEENHWKARCPIAALRQDLEVSGNLADVEFEAMEEAAGDEVAEAVAFAEQSPTLGRLETLSGTCA